MDRIVISPEDLTKCFRAGQKQGIVAGIAISIVARYVIKRTMERGERVMDRMSTIDQ